MATLQALIGGQLYNLSDQNPFGLAFLDGVGMPPIRRLSQHGPQQHGVTDVGFQLDQRLIRMAIFYAADSKALAVASRDLFYRLFTPSTTIPIQLRYTRDDGSIRQIDAHCIGEIDLPGSERLGPAQQWMVTLQAADPAWYEPTVVQLTATGGTDQAGMSVPMVMPLLFGGGPIDASFTITYQGTLETFPIITLVGPMATLTITNVSTGAVLSLSDAIPAGTTVTVDLTYGQKTVIDHTGANRIAWLSNSSDLGTWSLVPAPQVPGKTNEVTIVGTGATGATLVTLSYYNRFVGV